MGAARAEIGKPCREFPGIVSALGILKALEAAREILGAAAFIFQDAPEFFGDFDGKLATSSGQVMPTL